MLGRRRKRSVTGRSAAARWRRASTSSTSSWRQRAGRRNRSARCLGQVGVQRGDHLGALADCRGYALDRGGANVADGEHAAPAGLQRVLMIARIGTGQHKAFGIERDAGAGKPIGVRLGADEQEQVANVTPHLWSGFLPGGVDPPAYGFENAVAASRPLT